MRLNSIKLSGFKSFVEPTTFILPGQLVGVVGPNGCGKSNIMDAVRWVLGESKASELRGESMQDVIFNGTTTRKAASRASVELIFDNEDNRAGGQWSQFGEIAVKRVLTRDGNSSYYINNQVVRRRDVQDVFLGTGLGPRAYAIIGQGTISRIIESKPEELRLFLEEAAGVSKYKERRRETENRLSDTRDNLTRVEDILRELNSNLRKLEQQAEIATKYNSLQSEANLKQQQLWFFKRAEAKKDQFRFNEQAQNSQTILESRVSDVRHVEAELEKLRQAHYDAGDEVNKTQGSLYEASAEVGKLEAEIRFVVDGRQRVQQRITSLNEQASQWGFRYKQAEYEFTESTEKALSVRTQHSLLTSHLEELSNKLSGHEKTYLFAQNEASQHKDVVAQVQQKIQILSTDQRHIEEQSNLLIMRRDKLMLDKTVLNSPDAENISHLKVKRDQAQETATTAEKKLQALQGELPIADQKRSQQQEVVNQETIKKSNLSARLIALKSIQEKVKTDGKLQPWLVKHGLNAKSGLWIHLHIEEGWENALEGALRERLRAIEVSRLEILSPFSQDPPPAKLAFYSTSVSAVAKASNSLELLSDKLKFSDASQQALIVDWLSGSFVGNNLEEAIKNRENLLPGQQIFVKEGHSVSLYSVSFYAPDSEQSGLLARAQEIENIEKQLKAQILIFDESHASLVKDEAAYTQVSQRLNQMRQEAAQSQSLAHNLQVEFLQLTQLAEKIQSRSDQLDVDLVEIKSQLDGLSNRQLLNNEDFEKHDVQLSHLQERQVTLDDKVAVEQVVVNDFRDNQRLLQNEIQDTFYQLKGFEARQVDLARALETSQSQINSVEEETIKANDELSLLSDVAAKSGLQIALSLKIEREKILSANRSTYDDLTSKLRSTDERRLQFERELEPLRQRISEFKLKEQAARIGLEQYTQNLNNVKADLNALNDLIEKDDIRLAGLQFEIDRLNKEALSLGAVNLAALEELKTASERKFFLDAQSADLVEAMTTLEEAIKKIDAETRELLSGTFNSVNEHFGKMFPELFGGGNARLVITGEEILDSGVQVVAQPPGKKNQTIHLLSGGEKALTAIALVFAIFQLNPAPFCLLDEVDAPLDDANTERYAKLVSKMSKETQFLFISHNKIAMEMAHQLIGVTMQEQGVSRIVAVDMDTAVSLVEA